MRISKIVIAAAALSLLTGSGAIARGGMASPGAARNMRLPAMPASGTMPKAMGIVVRTGAGYYVLKSMNGASVRLGVTHASHFFKLDPGARASIKPGWNAHAIGTETHGILSARMLVLFPPASAAGVPPPSSGFGGIGRVIKANPLTLRGPGGKLIHVRLLPGARIVVAHTMPFSRLRPGDRAMTFAARSKHGLNALIVHVQPGAGKDSMRAHH
ncbi:MAG TPA: hypothetical protein VFJ58_23490 [Armatimonadota bacterium]|nr:hypothetical protein [Armatimonadota bacterium]